MRRCSATGASSPYPWRAAAALLPIQEVFTGTEVTITGLTNGSRASASTSVLATAGYDAAVSRRPATRGDWLLSTSTFSRRPIQCMRTRDRGCTDTRHRTLLTQRIAERPGCTDAPAVLDALLGVDGDAGAGRRGFASRPDSRARRSGAGTRAAGLVAKTGTNLTNTSASLRPPRVVCGKGRKSPCR